MWRPFAFNFVPHAFDVFRKRHERAESAPLELKIELVENEKFRKMRSVRVISEEAKQRMQEFKNLKLRVKQQREMIKITDYNLKKRHEMRLKTFKDVKEKEKEKKKENMIRIRTFSKSKPVRNNRNVTNRPVSDKFGSKKETKSLNTTIFGLTAPNEKNILPRLKSPFNNFVTLSKVGELNSKIGKEKSKNSLVASKKKQ